MRIGVIAELLKLPLHRGIRKAAELGAEGVQLYALGKESSLLEMNRAQLKELKSCCEDEGLAISAVCGDIGGHGFQIAADNPARLETSRRIVDVTRQLGCDIITTHVGVIPASKNNDIYKIMCSALCEFGSYASENGAVVAIETGPEPAKVLKRFLDEAGLKGLGVNLDPANLVMVLDEDPVEAVHTLRDYIVHTHAKDGIHYRKCDPVRVYGAFAEGGFERLVAETGKLFAEVPLGEGAVDWDAYLKALKDIGFDGFLTIEREVGEDPVGDIKKAIEFLKRKTSKY